MNTDPQEEVRFNWGEARYFDLWALPHLLSGVGLAFFFLAMGGLRAFSYGLTLFILAGWELLVEGPLGIREVRENSVLDVIIGFIGFVLAYEIGRLTLGMEAIRALFVFDIIVLSLLSLFGWFDFQKRRRG